MYRTENDMYGTKSSSYRDTQKFSDTLLPIGGKNFKRILTYCIKYNEYNKRHSDIPKHVSYEK